MFDIAAALCVFGVALFCVLFITCLLGTTLTVESIGGAFTLYESQEQFIGSDGHRTFHSRDPSENCGGEIP